MISISQTTTGLFKFVQRPNRDELLSGAWAAALKQSLGEYARGTMRGARLGDRFQPSAFMRYGLSGRSAKYMKYQRKYLGTPTPYVSPRPMNLTKVAQAVADLANGRGNATVLLRTIQNAQKNANRPHMRDLVTKPGGYVARSTGKRQVVVTMSYPGARILNKLGGNGATYRREFNDLARGGGRDLNAILTRAALVYDEIVAGYMGRAA